MTLRLDDPDGRVLEAFIVGFDEIVSRDDSGTYRERFIPGVFREQIESKSPLRIWFDLQHQKDTVVGHAVGLRELGAGVYGGFAIHPGAFGDKVLEAVRTGLTGVSIKATPLRSRDVDGVTRRMKAHLMAVSFVANPGYPTAEVFGIRRARREEQAGPASPAEFLLWEMEQRDGKLGALQLVYLDEALEMQRERRRWGGSSRSFETDPLYQRVTKLRQQNAELIAKLRAELEPQIAPSPHVDDPLRPRVLHRDCGEVFAVLA